MAIIKPWLCSMCTSNQRTARAAYHNSHQLKCLATIAMTENSAMKNTNSHSLDAPNSDNSSSLANATWNMNSFFGRRSSAIMKNYSSIVEFNSLGEITTTETGIKMCGSSDAAALQVGRVKFQTQFAFSSGGIILCFDSNTLRWDALVLDEKI